MPNHELEFTIDLDGLSERIESHRATCEQFLNTRLERLQHVEHGLFENLDKIAQQHSDWEDYRTETEKQRLGLRKDRQQLERDRAGIEARMLEIDERSLDTDEQRKRIAKKIKEQRAAIRNVNINADEVSRLEATIASLQTELKEQANQQNSDETQALREQLEAVQDREKELKAKAAEGVRVANERGKQIKALREQLKENGPTGSSSAELAILQAERDQLAENLEELKGQLEQGSGGMDNQASAELKNQIEQLQRENEVLKLEVQSSRDSFDFDLQEDATDWERRKHEMMRKLNADDDDNLDNDHQSKVDAAIRETDRLVAAKDAKIADLQGKLEQLVEMVEKNQREQANQQPVNEDERIMSEQKRLKELQDQWKEKLREAEVEIAVQRAEFARQQSELEEKARDVKAQLALAKKQVALSTGDKDDKRKKGWLKR